MGWHQQTPVILFGSLYTFTLHFKIHETVASCPKKTVCDRDQKPYFKSEHINIRIKSFFKHWMHHIALW